MPKIFKELQFYWQRSMFSIQIYEICRISVLWCEIRSFLRWWEIYNKDISIYFQLKNKKERSTVERQPLPSGLLVLRRAQARHLCSNTLEKRRLSNLLSCKSLFYFIFRIFFFTVASCVS